MKIGVHGTSSKSATGVHVHVCGCVCVEELLPRNSCTANKLLCFHIIFSQPVKNLHTHTHTHTHTQTHVTYTHMDTHVLRTRSTKVKW